MTSLVGCSVAIAFALAIAFGAATNSVPTEGVPVIFWCLALSYAVQWIMFSHAWVKKTEHYYDLTGSLTYITLVVFALGVSETRDLRDWVLAVLVMVWAGRLGTFLFQRVRGAGEDRRFRQAKQSFPLFFMFWTLQGTWVFVTLSCALAAISSQLGSPIATPFWIGLALWIAGFTIEVVADRQKSAFRADPANAQKFINTGIWAWSRHPNYFGEIVLWTGIAVIAIPDLIGWQYLTLISPLFVIVLLTFISGVRLLEARADKQWGDDPEYQAYKRSTPTLMLWKPRG